MKITKLLVIVLALLVLACAFAACGTPDETTKPDVTVPVTEPHIHNYVETVVIVPTCNTIGKSVKMCGCGDVLANSEMPVPLLAHDVTEVTCTEDSVCRLCVAVVVERYGHTYAETVVSVASCTTEGVITTKCVRCGEAGETKTVPAGHSFDETAIKVSKGDVSATCTKCGASFSLLAGEPVLKIDFDSMADIDAISALGLSATNTGAYKFEDGTCQPNGAMFVNYEPEFVTNMAKYVISFDFKLAAQGRTTGGDSIFSFCAKNPNTYTWMIKFYQSAGVISTATENFDASNSVPATLGEWYNFTAIVDNATRKAEIYIDGVNIGTMNTINYTSGRTDFSFRFGDIPGNAPSTPYFDNFKLVGIK